MRWRLFPYPPADVPVELRTLTDGGQAASEVAGEIATFLNDAHQSLELALYDVRL